MRHVISEAEAQRRIAELLRRASEQGETFVIERGGKPAVVLAPAARDEPNESAKRQDWQQVHEEIRRLRAQIAAKCGGELKPPPEEVIRQMREERSAQLTDLP